MVASTEKKNHQHRQSSPNIKQASLFGSGCTQKSIERMGTVIIVPEFWRADSQQCRLRDFSNAEGFLLVPLYLHI